MNEVTRYLLLKIAGIVAIFLMFLIANKQDDRRLRRNFPELFDDDENE